MVLVMLMELGAADNERQSKGSLDLQLRDFPLRNAAAYFHCPSRFFCYFAV
jgi:hypothetical protein